MQESMSDLAAKYREEMLRLYGNRAQQSDPPEPPQSDLTDEEENAPQSDLADEAENAPEEAGEQAAPPASESPAEPPPPLDGEYKDNDEDRPADAGDTAFDYPPESLPEYIAPYPVPDLPPAWSAQEEYERRNTSEGYLRVITAAADSAYPVPGARVTVSTRIGGELYLNYVLVTNENGETPTVSLPAPPAALSQDPQHEDPFAVCDIRAEAEGFYPGEAEDVPVFAGVTSRQVFQLVPLPLRPGADADDAKNPAGRDE